ncbi:unnamed protein product [Camellia sinensis]
MPNFFSSVECIASCCRQNTLCNVVRIGYDSPAHLYDEFPLRKFLRMLMTLHDDMEVCYGKTQQRELICTCEN